MTPIEQVVTLIQSRRKEFLYDDLCISKNGKYLGTVTIQALLQTITQKSIELAKGASPLTGLPGNEFIQRMVSRLLEQRISFDVCYLDIDDKGGSRLESPYCENCVTRQHFNKIAISVLIISS